MASPEATLFEYHGPLVYLPSWGYEVKDGDRLWYPAPDMPADGFSPVEEQKKGDPKPLNTKADALAALEHGVLQGSGNITEADR